MENKTGIIGMDGSGKAVAEALKNKGVDVIIVDEPNSRSYDESFDLNGVKYAPIKTEQRKHKHVSSKLGGSMGMEKVDMNANCLMELILSKNMDLFKTNSQSCQNGNVIWLSEYLKRITTVSYSIGGNYFIVA
jgi:lactate dehydrogenase-like 2-hydroxyacid dehydrogenase